MISTDSGEKRDKVIITYDILIVHILTHISTNILTFSIDILSNLP